MFVVREGELQILKHGKGGAEYKLAVLKVGDCVGEMSLIDIQPRSATARAVGTATLYVLDLAEIGKLYGPTSRRTRCWSSTSRARSAAACASPTRCWRTWG